MMDPDEDDEGSDASHDLEDVHKLQCQDSGDEDEGAKALPFTEKPAFNSFIGVVILLNAVSIGAELQIEGIPEQEPGSASASDDSRVTWYAFQFIFCFIFFLEIVARIYYLKSRYFCVFANVFDFVLVLTAIIDTWIAPFIPIEENLRIFSIFRILRLLKLIRLIRFMKIFQDLWLIVIGLIESLKTLAWVCGLLVLFVYVCAIFLTTQVGHNDAEFDPHFRETKGWDHEYYFGTVSRSMFTLVQIITRDGWCDDIARHVIQIYPSMGIFFIAFVTFASYGMLSLIVGVIVESTLAESKHNESKLQKAEGVDRERVLEHLRSIFALADENRSGTISMEEIYEAIKNPEISMKLQTVGFPVENPGEIFALLDVGHTGKLTIEEFINGCMRLKGGAKSKDLLLVQVCINNLGKNLALLDEKWERAQDKIALLDRKTQKLWRQTQEMFADPRRKGQ